MDWSKDWPVIAGAAVVLVGLVVLSKGSAGQTVVSAGAPSGKSDAVAIAEIQAKGSGYASLVNYMLADRRYASAEAIAKLQADEQIQIANARANQENQAGFLSFLGQLVGLGGLL